MVISYDPLYFCGFGCNFYFVSDFVCLCVPTLFFFLSLVKSFSILFIFSKNHLLDLLVFPIIFVVLISFISTLLYYFLPSSNF